MLHYFEKIAPILLLLLALIVGGSACYRYAYGDGSPLVISDIKSLSPALSSDPNIDKVLENLRQGIENNIVMILLGEDEDTLSLAQETIVSNLEEKSNLYEIIGAAQVDERISPLMTRSRFHLLTDQQVELLHGSSDESVLKQVKHKVYGFGGMTRSQPLVVDPFGLYSEYLTASVGASRDYSEPTLTEGGIYMVVITISLRDNVLGLNKDVGVTNQLLLLKEHIVQNFENIELLYSGFALIAEATSSATQKEISVISGLSGLGVMVILILGFSSLYVLLLPTLSILAGVLGAFLINYSFFGSVHLFTLLFGASLIGVAVDYSLHYLCHQGVSLDQRKTLYRALFFSLLTSVIGYSALAFSDLISLKRVAFFSMAGLFFSWLMVVSLGRYIGTKTPSFQLSLRSKKIVCCGLSKIYIVIRYWPISLVLGALFIGVARVEYNDGPSAFFSINPTLLHQEQRVSSYIDDYEPGKFIVIKGRDISSVTQYVSEIKRDTLSDGQSLTSFYDWIPTRAEQQSHYALQSRLYDEKGLIEIWFKEIGFKQEDIAGVRAAYSQHKDYLLDPISIIDAAGGILPKTWMQLDGDVYAVLRIRKGQDLSPFIRYSNEHDHITFVDTVEDIRQALQLQRESASQLLFAAYLLVAFFLVLRYWSFSALSMLAIPALSSMFVFICFYIFSVPVTLFHIMALFLILGLGMDYTIFLKEMNGHTRHRYAALVAIGISCITSMISFGSLSLSSMGVVSGFGLTLLLGCLANLVLSFSSAQIDQ